MRTTVDRATGSPCEFHRRISARTSLTPHPVFCLCGGILGTPSRGYKTGLQRWQGTDLAVPCPEADGQVCLQFFKESERRTKPAESSSQIREKSYHGGEGADGRFERGGIGNGGGRNENPTSKSCSAVHFPRREGFPVNRPAPTGRSARAKNPRGEHSGQGRLKAGIVREPGEGQGRSTMGTDPEARDLSASLVGEIFKALGQPEHGWARRVFGPLFSGATDRFSEIGLAFDRRCKSDGFPSAAQWALSNWCRSMRVRGTENIPPEGALLILSNHPGTYDMLVVASQLKRRDVGIFSSNIPFLMGLPNACHHFFFVDLDAHARMGRLRDAVRHLRAGGIVLLQGSGQIDPDPAVFGGAAQSLEGWSRSVDLFLELAPTTRVLLSVVSHVVSQAWARSPLTWLRRQPLDKRRLVEFGQVLQQTFFPGSLYLSPRLSIGSPISVETLRSESGSGSLLPTLIAHEKELLAEHLTAFGGA